MIFIDGFHATFDEILLGEGKMPFLEVNGVRIHYTDEGKGEETIVFSHGLLFSGHMFRARVAALKDRYRCITFDHRGQGKSAVALSGYDMDTLYEDAAALIEALEAGPCHFAGHSMGGFVGMRLAARRPELLRSLILLNTTAAPEPRENHGKYRMLNFIARWFGFRVVLGKVAPIMIGPSFLTDQARKDDLRYWKNQIAAGNRIGVTRAVRGVVDRKGVLDEIGAIDQPVLILAGAQDVATIPAKSGRIHELIFGSELVTLPLSGHSSVVEEPDLVTAEMERFLVGVDS